MILSHSIAASLPEAFSREISDCRDDHQLGVVVAGKIPFVFV
jgi:hypothetical protein